MTVCEDLWDDQPAENQFSRNRLYTTNPMKELMKFNPDFIVNIAASPFAFGRQHVKRQIFTEKQKKHGIPVFMVNQTGANTELIFEGGSLAISASGSVAHQLNFFENDYIECELEDVKNFHAETLPEMPNRIGLMHDALAMGIRDYFLKSGFSKATLGLSGGIDSAVTLAIAAKALEIKNLHVLLMPSQYSSDHSISDSEEMAKILGVSYDILPIEKIFNLYREALKPLFGRQAR